MDWLILKIGACIHQVLQQDSAQDVTLSLCASVTFVHAAGKRVLCTLCMQPPLRAKMFRKQVVVSGYRVMRTACLVVMAQHLLNSISPIIHLHGIHPRAEEQD